MAEDAVVVPVITPDTAIILLFVVIVLAIIYFIIREVRLMKTGSRSLEIELEREKIRLLQQHEAAKLLPFTRFSPDQTAAIKQAEDENVTIGTDNAAKEILLDKRLSRLENIVKSKKLDHLLHNIQEQEKKVK